MMPLRGSSCHRTDSPAYSAGGTKVETGARFLHLSDQHYATSGAKPENPYGYLYGYRETSNPDTLRDAAFRAGAQLKMLVRQILKRQMTMLQERWQQESKVIEF